MNNVHNDNTEERQWSKQCEVCNARNCQTCTDGDKALLFDKHQFEAKFHRREPLRDNLGRFNGAYKVEK